MKPIPIITSAKIIEVLKNIENSPGMFGEGEAVEAVHFAMMTLLFPASLVQQTMNTISREIAPIRGSGPLFEACRNMRQLANALRKVRKTVHAAPGLQARERRARKKRKK